MNQNEKILITGASGKTGSRIAKRLTDLGYAIRTAGRGKSLPNGANEHVIFDWFDESTHEAALKDVDKLYLVGPIAVMDPSEIVMPFLERALKTGVRRIVLLGSASIPEEGPVFGKIHRAIRELAPEWAVLRPSYFMQNFVDSHGAQILNDGTIVSATGSGRVGFVDADDIAEVGVRALTDKQPHNTDHIITGPDSLTYAEAGDIIGAAAGRTIRHVNVPTQELANRFMAFGMPQDYARFLAGMDEDIRLYGKEDLVTDTVERITGRPPKSLKKFAEEHAANWKTAK
ncbi:MULTISPECIES: NmrA family NAD(P)-binding protein [Paenibacillus]|uniref:Oxidoreductase YesF n=1 Tax=Paenibacillus albilobatus TaxID=2716884 RepID=A0A919XPV9_9BACL|nr:MULTISPECIES: NAD-dependent epimerase/dehydratase family protein [Paenibacillus]GIO34567.1 putative oxidoreductase YesF [Paenibacillus albilobatus]